MNSLGDDHGINKAISGNGITREKLAEKAKNASEIDFDDDEEPEKQNVSAKISFLDCDRCTSDIIETLKEIGDKIGFVLEKTKIKQIVQSVCNKVCRTGRKVGKGLEEGDKVE